MVDPIKNFVTDPVKEWNKHIEKEKRKRMRRLTQEEFINKCLEIHGNKYDYNKTIYVNTRTNITIVCKEHGEFTMKPDNHAQQKQGCLKCALKNHKLVEISKERLEGLKTIHNNRYEYNDLSVNDGYINITCKEHGIFRQTIYIHERGHGCTQCGIEDRKVIKVINRRTCKTCSISKEVSEFDKKRKSCKSCFINPIIPSIKICNRCNSEKEIDMFPIKKSAIDGHMSLCNDCVIPNRRKRGLIYRKERMASDPFYRAKIDARNVVRKAISKGGYSKKSRTEEILGCSFVQFKEHIESQFMENMSWSNRSKWQIDHIIPISFAKDEGELLLINHYTNLRPLWTIDNQLKSDNIEIRNDIYDLIMSERV